MRKLEVVGLEGRSDDGIRFDEDGEDEDEAR